MKWAPTREADKWRFLLKTQKAWWELHQITVQTGVGG